MTEKQREQRRLADLRYRKRHAEKHRARARRYYEENRERVRERQRQYREENRLLIQEQQRRYQKSPEQKDRFAQYLKAYRQANPDVWREAGRRRRARKLEAPGSCSAEQLAARFAYYGDRCAYCGAKGELHADHVIPLSQGGSEWPANFRPACEPCNKSKAGKLLSEWRGRQEGERHE
jgi:5-methylcytosine-specific restriction endonuclease McrA